MNADTTESTIHKYPIEEDGGWTDIELPAASKLLTMQVDQATGKPSVWIELNPNQPKVKTLGLQIVMTGGRVPFGDYVGTYQHSIGYPDDRPSEHFVGHVYSQWK